MGKSKTVQGYVTITYLKDHGSYSKDDSHEMPKSTAEALASHKVVKIGKKVDKFVPKEAKK
jgi:hypothetical protein